MKLVSFQKNDGPRKGGSRASILSQPFLDQKSASTSRRVGCWYEGRVIDLSASLEAKLLQKGTASPASCRELSQSLIPWRMTDFIARGALALDYAQEALEFAKQEGLSPPLAFSAGSNGEVGLLAPLVPESLRDFSCFEGHIINCLKQLGREPVIPQAFYRNPVYYKGNRFSVVGPESEILWPKKSVFIDYELEIAAVVGKQGKNIPKEEALEYLYGYMIMNDFSARDMQEHDMSSGLGPAKCKDFDTGTALGPWLVTSDEIDDPQNLAMTAQVNGQLWSEGNTRSMFWSFTDVIAYLSEDETLYPGEVIGSGTVGSGSAFEQGKKLADGDIIELTITGLGTLTNRIRQQ